MPGKLPGGCSQTMGEQLLVLATFHPAPATPRPVGLTGSPQHLRKQTSGTEGSEVFVQLSRELCCSVKPEVISAKLLTMLSGGPEKQDHSKLLLWPVQNATWQFLKRLVEVGHSGARKRETDLCKFEAWSSGHPEPHSDSVPKEGGDRDDAKLSPGMRACNLSYLGG